MKFLRFPSNWLSSSSGRDGYRQISVLFFSNQTQTQTTPRSSSSSSSSSLFKRISGINDPKASIVPILEKWVDEGKPVTYNELRSCISSMRNFNRFHHALQISQWMTDRRYFDLTSSDVAVRLKLIYYIHGLQHVEKYFNNISKQFKVSETYGALLNCYVNDKSVEKAEAVMQEMKTMGLAKSSFPFNLLMSLYAQTGEQEKIDILVNEMAKQQIPQDKYTLTNRLVSCIALSDIEGMENILKLMEDPSIKVDWTVYAVAARGYLKIGLIDKALEMIKEVEARTEIKRTNVALKYLLTLYAGAGKKDDVYRIWNLYKTTPGVRGATYSRSSFYACMISSLGKLDDIVGAEKIWEEWSTRSSSYDSRVLNQLVSVYCKRGLLEKAEELVQKVLLKIADSEKSFYASSWNILAMGYLSNKQIIKGVEMLKKAFSIGREGWKPNLASVVSCLEYFEAQRDVKGADEFLELLATSGPLTKEVYHRMLRIYIAANKPVSRVLDLMKADGFSADEETDKILQGNLVSSGDEGKDQSM